MICSISVNNVLCVIISRKEDEIYNVVNKNDYEAEQRKI